MPTPPLFVLASASPARRQLLLKAGITPIVQPSHFDESSLHRDDPAELVEQLALGKANAVAQQLRQRPETLGLEVSELPGSKGDPSNDGLRAVLVMGCDSLLVVNGMVQGKPETPEIAIARWQQMRGGVGALLTGHVLIDLWGETTLLRHQVTQVSFAQVSDRQIEAYVATGEPLHCAGAFALEGRGGVFVEQITGCYSNVIGLSLPLLREMISLLGYAVSDFWGDVP